MAKPVIEATLKQLTRTIPTILGRFNPLTIGHKYQVFSPLVSDLPKIDSPTPDTYFLAILGTCNPDRDLTKNPLNFDQRVDLSLITLSELLQNQYPDLVSEENRKKLAQHDGIRQIIDVESSFVPHFDTPGKNTPPSLDPLHDRVVGHCAKYNIPLEQLAMFSSIRDGELGKAYQIGGKIYENTSQLGAVAKHIGVRSREVFPDSDVQVVSATKVREDFAKTFDTTSPRVFLYLQKLLAGSILNNCPISNLPKIDALEDASKFVAELAQSKKMLNFSKEGRGAIVDVPQESHSLFSYYHVVAKLNGTPGKTPTTIDEKPKTLVPVSRENQI